MVKQRRIKKTKCILFILVMLLVIGLILYLIPWISDLSTMEGKIAFKEEIERLGIWGVLMLFVFQVAQIFFVVLPGEPFEILAGMCFGGIGGAIFIFVSVFIISTAIVFLVKKYGKKFIYEFWKKEKIDKIENSKLFQNPKNLEYIMIALFMIPGTPKDLLVYIGGLLPIPTWKFICIATFLRFPSVISSTFAGEKLVVGDWKITILIYVVTILLTVAILFISNRLDKNKTTEEVLKTLK